MRVSLLYNRNAGGGVSEQSVVERIESAGHTVVAVFEKDSDFEGILDRPTDLVAVAGGDGTVHAAARALAGRGVPLAILPLGTANNIARSLGIEDSIPNLARGWTSARRAPFDLGHVEGDWAECCFVEGVGSGLLPEAIEAAKSANLGGSPDTELRSALRCYRETLAGLRARHWVARIDGTRLEGEFLLLEVLNTRFVGPNLLLSPTSDPSDGALEVLAVREEGRQRLDDLLRRPADGLQGELLAVARRAKHVEIEGWDRIHVDDEVLSGPAHRPISIRVEPARLAVLV
jgi:diacylglycerol kinase (ATP)